jgi:hypothetical protein
MPVNQAPKGLTALEAQRAVGGATQHRPPGRWLMRTDISIRHFCSLSLYNY